MVPKYVQRNVQNSLIYVSLLMLILALILGLYRGGVHLAQLKPEDITLRELPWALTLSLFRMSVSYLASLILSFVLGLSAARFKLAERLIIPFLDIMQSVPVVGFFPAAISFFIGLSQGQRIGVEAAAIFLILTSQAWNMAFAVYEATKTIPQDSMDAVFSFGVRGSQRFWKLYAPACVPRLVYNSILSWSNGWYFLVACEIITVGPIKYNLPGIGSFLARAAEEDRIGLVLWGLLSLALLILALDVIIWRPASAWAEKFRQDFSGASEAYSISRASPFFLDLLPKDFWKSLRPFGKNLRKLIRVFSMPISWLLKEVILPIVWDLPSAIFVGLSREIYARLALPAMSRWHKLMNGAAWIRSIILWALGAAIGVACGTFLVRWFSPPWPALTREIPLALLASTARLVVTLAISIAITLPVIHWCWDRPKLRQTLTTFSQIGAGLPAVALFPLIFLFAVRRLGGGMEVATLFLMLTGMLWYVMFNGLGGAAIIPADLTEATGALGLTRAQKWKYLVIPAIRPALITGAITAWGGGWNTLVVAEYVAYKGNVISVNGIGALLDRAVYETGDTHAMGICISAMVGWIVIINVLVWRRLYQNASERYRFDG